MMLKTLKILLFIVFTLALPANADTFEQALKDLKSDFKTSAEAAQGIYQMAVALEALSDRRAQFAHIYAITIAMTSEQIKKGRFKNPVWTESLVLNYANLYRETIFSELNGNRSQLPLAWQRVFNLAESEKWNGNFDLIYGIKVHVTRDLVEALYVTPTDYRSVSVQEDFFAITEVLQSAMPLVWEVHNRFSKSMSFVPFLTQDAIGNWIGRLRERAWEDAVKSEFYSEAQRIEVLRRLDKQSADDSRNWGLILILL